MDPISVHTPGGMGVEHGIAIEFVRPSNRVLPGWHTKR